MSRLRDLVMAVLSRIDRWWGAAIGLALGIGDTCLLVALEVRLEFAGHDATIAVGSMFSSSLTMLGFLLGLTLEKQRRERAAAAALQERSRELAQVRARLAETERLAALGQLAGAIAHEVKNPLAIIRSSIQNVSEALQSSASAERESCTFIIEEIDRLARVTNSLLGFVRPLPIRSAPVHPSELLRRVDLLGRELAREGGLRLSMSGAEGPRVTADADLVCQVLLGLIGNAVQASEPGEAIEVSCEPEDDGVRLVVDDRGPGVPDADKARVFEPLFTTKKAGTGLGLAIARQIVEAHGGRIGVADRPGGGARFFVWLPAEPRAT